MPNVSSPHQGAHEKRHETHSSAVCFLFLLLPVGDKTPRFGFLFELHPSTGVHDGNRHLRVVHLTYLKPRSTHNEKHEPFSTHNPCPGRMDQKLVRRLDATVDELSNWKAGELSPCAMQFNNRSLCFPKPRATHSQKRHFFLAVRSI